MTYSSSPWARLTMLARCGYQGKEGAATTSPMSSAANFVCSINLNDPTYIYISTASLDLLHESDRIRFRVERHCVHQHNAKHKISALFVARGEEFQKAIDSRGADEGRQYTPGPGHPSRTHGFPFEEEARGGRRRWAGGHKEAKDRPRCERCGQWGAWWSPCPVCSRGGVGGPGEAGKEALQAGGRGRTGSQKPRQWARGGIARRRWAHTINREN
jgi:hypothetical protein